MIKPLEGKCYKITPCHTTGQCQVCGIQPDNQILYEFDWNPINPNLSGQSIIICKRCLIEIAKLTVTAIEEIEEGEGIVNEVRR